MIFPIGTTDIKILHTSSSTLCAKEMIFGKTHVPMFKGAHERLSPDSSRISLSGTIIDFTQILQSFKSLCQTTTTSVDPLPQKNPSGVLMCPEKRASLALTFHYLLPPVLTLQHTRREQCYSSSSPAQPHQPFQAAHSTQLLLRDLYINILIHQYPLSNPFLSNSALHSVNLPEERFRTHQQGKGLGSHKVHRKGVRS